MLNTDLAAVVIHEGFAFHSRHDAPVLRGMVDPLAALDASDASALRLARVLKQVRPELDLYLLSNRRVEEIARQSGCRCGPPRVLCRRGTTRAAPRGA